MLPSRSRLNKEPWSPHRRVRSGTLMQPLWTSGASACRTSGLKRTSSPWHVRVFCARSRRRRTPRQGDADLGSRQPDASRGGVHRVEEICSEGAHARIEAPDRCRGAHRGRARLGQGRRIATAKLRWLVRAVRCRSGSRHSAHPCARRPHQARHETSPVMSRWVSRP